MFTKRLPLSSQELTNLLFSLQQQPGVAYLDSAADNHHNSNFSVFAWSPLYTLKADLTVTNVYQQETLIEESFDDPLTLVQQYLDYVPKITSELPFQGGAIGYWDYEFGGRYEHLPAARNNDITLPNMFVGIYDQFILLDPVSNQVTFVSHRTDAEQVFDELHQQAKQAPATVDFKLQSDWQSNMSKPDYQMKFDRIQDYLKAGDCYQINLAQRFAATYQGDEWQAYLKLRASNAAPFSSFIRLHEGVVLSVSPERFLQVQSGVVETKPIKGTRPRHNDIELDKQNAHNLQIAEKDRAENLMIVDLLRNDLSKVAEPGSVEVPQLFAIESFPAVHHLVSTVTAKIRPPFTAIDLLRGAFPGGSITGAPKIRAMEIIHELEPDPRSVYCGAIGYIQPNGDMDTNITIRTLVCNQQTIYCWAGGGIVADSKCDEEYQETLDKVNRILPNLVAM